MNYAPPDNTVYPIVTNLPQQIRFGEGFRDDVIVFARSTQPDIVLTNLPVDDLPEDLSVLCSNIAEKALLAYVIATGESLQYAHLDYCIEKMQRLAREFAAKFLQPLGKEGTTQVIPQTDMDNWYSWHGLYGWGRAIRNPPGTEYA